MSKIKFVDAELKKKVIEFARAKLERAMMDGGGFGGVEKTDLARWIKNVYPDVTNDFLTELLTQLKTAGIIEEV